MSEPMDPKMQALIRSNRAQLESAFRREGISNQEKSAEELIQPGELIKIKGRVFKVKSANPREVRLRILSMGR